MANFMKAASKQASDVRNFLRNASGGNNIKYSAEKGAKHLIYIPPLTEEVVDEATQQVTVVQKINAREGNIHEWYDSSNKFHSTVCTKGIFIEDADGKVIADGTCPFCDRVRDGWDIYNYRKALEEEQCMLHGENRKAHLEKANAGFRDQRKAKEAKKYLYLLVVKFRTDSRTGDAILGSDGFPEYDLKVMRMSPTAVDKLNVQITNSGSELPGSELTIQYPNIDDVRQLSGQRTTAPVFPNNRMICKYPGLEEKINNDIAKFDWDAIDTSFPEWTGMPVATAKKLTDDMFKQWDDYKMESEQNPTAKYLEYVVETPTSKPSLGGEPVAGIPNIPNIPVVPGAVPPVVPGVTPSVPEVPVMPTVAPPVMPVAPGVAPAADPNAVFAGAGTPVAPTLTV